MSNDAITLWTGGGLVAAGVVAGSLAGALLTNWLGVRRDQRTHEHDQAMAREAHSHERAMALQAARHRQEMAQEARCQERLEKAYLELLTYLSHFLDWAKSVQPIWGPVPMPDPVPP